MPWPWYDLARFKLLLGDDDDALHCLLDAVASSTHSRQLETSLTSLIRMTLPTASPGWAYARDVLRLAAATLFDGAPPSGTKGLTGPVVVLSGASTLTAHAEVMTWLEPVAAAMPGWAAR